MAVAGAAPRADYIGEDSTPTYDFDFQVLDEGDLAIYEDGVLQSVPGDYTVTFNADRTGSVTRVDGDLPDGSLLAIVNESEIGQPVVLTRSNGYRPDVVERALDRLTIQIQGIQEKVRHAVRLPQYEDADGLLASATERASKLIGFDPDGNLTLATPTTGGGSGGSGSGFSVSITDEEFGAIGNGITLSTTAIQAAIEYVRDAGGGAVLIPDGTFLIDIAQVDNANWKHALTMYPGVVLRGTSRERSVLKLKSSAGNYMAILARSSSSDNDMDNVGLYDLCIDQNNDGNVPGSMGDLTGTGCARFAFAAYGGRRIAIRNCHFKGFKSINTLTFNAPIGMCGDVQVTGCLFEHATSASIANDHSTIYTSADDVVIAYNQFKSPAKNTYGATTAIELHGSGNSAYGNVVRNFKIGANVTGVADESDNVSFTQNLIDGGRYGVQLWSWFTAGNTDQPALTNCRVSGNCIRLDRDPWTQDANISFGISTDQVGTAPMRSVEISDNLIFWAATTAEPSISDQYSVGIGWERGTIEGQGYDEDITITNNTIIGAPANGIRVVANIHRLTISHNTIKNCGQSTSETFVPAYRAGIMAFPPDFAHNWYVHHNILVDDQVTPTMTNGFIHGDATAVDCRFEDNIWRVGAAHGVPVYSGSYIAAAGWYVRHACDAYYEDILGEVKAGSSIVETNTGITRTQTVAPQGAIYVAQTATLFDAFRIPWGKIDSSGGLDSDADLTVQFSGAATVILGGDLPGAIWANGAEGSTRGYYFTSDSIPRAAWFFSGDDEGTSEWGTVSLSTFDFAGGFEDSPMSIDIEAGGYVSFFRDVNLNGVNLHRSGAQVVGARKTGWGVPSGTLLRTTFDSSTITHADLAKVVAAVITDLHLSSSGHGLLGT